MTDSAGVAYARARSCLLVLTVALATACADRGPDPPSQPVTTDPSPSPPIEIRDSAGVRIVETHAPVGGVPRWTVDTVPLLEIGGGWPPDHLFGQIYHVALRRDGWIAVSDRASSDIAVFDASGQLVRTIGRRGDGPGEFASAPILRWGVGDTLLAMDPRALRLSWFDGDGDLAEERIIAWAAAEDEYVGYPDLLGEPGRRWRMSRYGDLLSMVELRNGDGDPRTRDGLLMHFIPADSDTLIDLGERTAFETFTGLRELGRFGISDPFRSRSTASLIGDPPRLLVADDTLWALDVLGADGRRTGFVRAAIPRVRLSEDILQAHRTKWIERGVSPSAYEDAFGRFVVPDSLPAIRSLSVDDSNNLWIGRGTVLADQPVEEWVVLDETGRWLATFERPAGMFIVAKGRHRVVALAPDELGVHRLRVHAVVER